jgi:hypothetical protein
MLTARQHSIRLIKWFLIASCLVVIPKHVQTNPGWFLATVTLLALAYSCAMVLFSFGQMLWALVFNNITGINHLRTATGLALGTLFFLYALTKNGLVLYEALESGFIKCTYRYCNETYTRKDNSADYWSSVWFSAFMEALMIILCALLIYALFKSIRGGRISRHA